MSSLSSFSERALRKAPRPARRTSKSWLMLLALLTLGSSASASAPQSERREMSIGTESREVPTGTENSVVGGSRESVIGGLRMVAPQLERFMLHGTIPMRAGTFLPGPNEGRYFLRGTDGQIFSAQANVVSRYANSNDGADVIELIAKVTRPTYVGPGMQLRFEVLQLRGATGGSPALTSAVTRMLRSPNTITLRTKDVFGNNYKADLLRDVRAQSSELRVLKSGHLASQFRTHENMAPTPAVSGAQGTLPHLMGIHSYVTLWRDLDIISIDLRVHNGHEGRLDNTDQDDPMGAIYFDGLMLNVPTGWIALNAYSAPSLGTPQAVANRVVTPLIDPLPGNKLHVMHPQAQFHRRIVLCREGSEDLAKVMLREAGLAFCEDGTNAEGVRYNSWWNPETSRYFAQNLPLPDLAYMEGQGQSRAEMSGDFNTLNGVLESGQPGPWPIISPALGWAHPYGDNGGGAVGGSGIVFFEGVKTAWSGSREGYRYYQIRHRMYTDRHRTALYKKNGDAFHMEDWIEQGPGGAYLPTFIWLVPWLPLGDPFGFLTAPDLHVNAVRAQGREPSYDATLEDFDYIDSAHLIRYTRSAKVLTWLGNDALSKDDLMLQGELCRASYTKLPQSPSGVVISTGLLADLQYVQSNPNDGFRLDREQGWMIDSAATAYAIQQPALRAQVLPWFGDVIDLLKLGQSNCLGSMMSNPASNHMQGQFRVLQTISECILQNALWGVRTTVYDGRNATRSTEINDIVRKSAYSIISNLVWEPGTPAPHFYTALGPFDQQQPSFCNYVPAGGYEAFDDWQIWNMFVFGFQLTQDARFLQRAADASGGVLSLATMGMNEHSGQLETRAGMVSFMQTVLGF